MKVNLGRAAAAGVLVVLASGCPPKTGGLRLEWSFGGQSCARAGALLVRVAVDGAESTWVGCSDQNNRQGTNLTRLTPGQHHLLLTAEGVGHVVVWSSQETPFQTEAGREGQLTVQMTSTGAPNPFLPPTAATKLNETGDPE